MSRVIKFFASIMRLTYRVQFYYRQDLNPWNKIIKVIRIGVIEIISAIIAILYKIVENSHVQNIEIPLEILEYIGIHLKTLEYACS